jgi:hypothetical protein
MDYVLYVLFAISGSVKLVLQTLTFMYCLINNAILSLCDKRRWIERRATIFVMTVDRQ